MTLELHARRRRRAATAAIGAVMLVAVAACGSAGGSAQKRGGEVDEAGLAAATARFEALKKPPADVWVPSEKLSQSMAGKTFYFIYIGGLPAFEQALKATTAANDAVGAKTVPLTFTPGTDELAARLNQALLAKPDGVFISGAPSSTITAQLETFKKAGIPVVSQATREKGDENLGFNGYDWSYSICADSAAIIVAESKGTANSLLVTYPQNSAIANGCTAGFEDYMKKNCPACETEIKDFTIGDLIAGKNPQIATGLMQSRPDTKYIFWQGANSVRGVPQALKAAGIDDVTQFSFGGDTKTWGDIQDGGLLGDLAYDIRYIGYRSADLMYRMVAGNDTTEAGKDSIPTQFLMKDTAPDPSKESDWFMANDYISQFQTSWGVS